MGAESMEAYTELLELNGETYEAIVLLDLVQAEALGQMTRKGFVEGWKQAWIEKNVGPDITSQKRYLRKRIEQVPGDPAFWKKLYQRAFLIGKEPEHKALKTAFAVAFWEMLFDPSVHPWQTKNVNWLSLWKTFLDTKWKRSVNKDMWNQTLVFSNKTMEDETLGFWSEDQAWPSVIDDFVLWCRETGAVASRTETTDGMEVDSGEAL